MGKGDGMSNGSLEWSINVAGEVPRELEPKSNLCQKVWSETRGLVMRFLGKIWRFLVSSWNLGVSDPKKFIHCVKVSLALCVVSLFYYMRPLYEGVGGNAMWAIMTVVVVFEYTVGATLSKSINRTVATILGGSLGVGVHWVASQAGRDFEPIILGASVFMFAGAATFSRFIPKVKARFDYGALIFILTFSLISVSGYRVDELFMLAHHRISTIMIGTSLCILISMLFCPVWAGNQLHNQTIQNLEKLANSLDECIKEYFQDVEPLSTCKGDVQKKRDGYKCVLNSKAAEDAMANFARWEPAHGQFSFRHPWKVYLKIGTAMRNFAYCVHNISCCLDSEVQVPEILKKNIEEECLKVSSYSSDVLKELAVMIRTMKKSSKIELSVGEMNFAVQELHNALKSLPTVFASPEAEHCAGDQTEKNKPTVVLLEVLPLAAMVALLTETVSRTEDIVDEVNNLAKLAEFASKNDKKREQNQSSDGLNSSDDQEQPGKAI